MAQDRTGSDASSLFASPARLLVGTLIFVAIVFVAAVSAYVAAGWPIADAAYMVTLTIFSVGYGEVRPSATPYLRVVTIATMVRGGTGMIVLTGALVLGERRSDSGSMRTSSSRSWTKSLSGRASVSRMARATPPEPPRLGCRMVRW